MTAQVDQFCAWAQPSNGTYINADAWSALSVWRAAQTQLAGDLVPQPGGTLLTEDEINALHFALTQVGTGKDPVHLLARFVEGAVLQKQRDLFAASLAQEEAP